ncbi:MAG: ATP-binding cassette domain-containing protein, partial [Bdellovibrionales bacterium]|nr:ATP-binding cassette domain-containing protein [Bdellovibrionales bacterium]
MLEIEEISFIYSQQAERLFDKLSFKIESGESVGLKGASGSGKSSLCRILAGHLKPHKGSIRLNGKDITGNPSRSIILIPQEDDLYPWLKGVDQVIIAQARRSHKEALKLLSLFKISQVAHLYPVQLSGGMKKRLALARAFAAQPAVMILDESLS